MNIFVYPCKGHWQAAMLHGLIAEDRKRDVSVCMCSGHPFVAVTVFRKKEISHLLESRFFTLGCMHKGDFNFY